jgi:hypothetical protein
VSDDCRGAGTQLGSRTTGGPNRSPVLAEDSSLAGWSRAAQDASIVDVPDESENIDAGRFGDNHLERGESIRRFLGTVVGLTLAWAVLAGFYAQGATGALTIFGNCGPEGYLGRAGFWRGGWHESAASQAAATSVLWAVAVCLAWRFRRIDGFGKAAMAFFVVTAIAATVVLRFLIAPPIWGSSYCDLG